MSENKERQYKSIKSFRRDIITDAEDNSVTESEEYILESTEFDDNHNIIKEYTYNNEGELEHYYVYNYNGKGHLIEEILYYENDELGERRKFDVDEKGDIIKEYVYYEDETFDTIEYKYDKDMNLIEKTTINSDGGIDEKEINEYRGGKLIMHAQFDSEEKKFSEINYEFNESGKLVEMTEWDSDTNTKSRLVNTYDENGNLIKKLNYVNNKLTEIDNFVVNEKNKISELTIENTTGKSILKLTYDDNDNIIEEAEYNKNDELNHKIVRKFNANNAVEESTVYVKNHKDGYEENYVVRYEYN